MFRRSVFQFITGDRNFTQGALNNFLHEMPEKLNVFLQRILICMQTGETVHLVECSPEPPTPVWPLSALHRLFPLWRKSHIR